MTSAKLINPKQKTYLKEFRVDIDLSEMDDNNIKTILRDLREGDWGLMNDLANIIERKD